MFLKFYFNMALLIIKTIVNKLNGIHPEQEILFIETNWFDIYWPFRELYQQELSASP